MMKDVLRKFLWQQLEGWLGREGEAAAGSKVRGNETVGSDSNGGNGQEGIVRDELPRHGGD